MLEIRSVAAFLHYSSSYIFFVDFNKSLNCMM